MLVIRSERGAHLNAYSMCDFSLLDIDFSYLAFLSFFMKEMLCVQLIQWSADRSAAFDLC